MLVTNGQVVINEFVASNSSTLVDEDGDSSDWIELHNPGSIPVNLAGFGISDNIAQPFRWVFPDVTIDAGEFLIVWASGKDRTATLHTNFSISAGGEPLQLVRPDGVVADFVAEVSLPRDVSYGRVPDGSEHWFYFDDPTPGEANSSTAWLKPLHAPELTHRSGFYESPVPVNAIPAEQGAIVRFTLNGDIPSENSPVLTTPIWMTDREGDADVLSLIPTATAGDGYWEWSGPPEFPVFKINTLRVRAFKEGHLPSPTVSASYLVGEDIHSRYSLPIVSIQSDYDSLFNSETGLFVAENYFNRGDDWEREAHIEFFEDGGLGFAQNIGVRIHGGYSRRAPLKSLRLYARGRYGESVFDYPVFPEKDNRIFERLILRSGGSDWALFPLRDAFAQSLVRELTNVSTQYYRSVITFLNGEYWGIMNLRDRYDHKYLEHEYDIFSADILTGSYANRENLNEHFLQFYQYLDDHNMQSMSHLDPVREFIDLDNFRDYHISQIYLMNTDMHSNNIDFWRSHDIIKGHPYADGKWRWLLFDVDASYGHHPDYAASPVRSGMTYYSGLNNILTTEVNPPPAFPHWAENHPSETMPLRKMLMNSVFREDFINRFADLLNTSFSASFAKERLAEILASVESYVPEHLNRWGIDRWHLPDDLSAWYYQRDQVLNFASIRPGFMRNDIKEFFNLEGEAVLTLDVKGGVDPGYIIINSIKVRSGVAGIPSQPYPWQGTYFSGLAVKVRAIPNPGFRFAGWEEYPDESSDSLEVVAADGQTFTAIFEPAPPAKLLHYWSFNHLQNPTDPSFTVGGGELRVEKAQNSEVLWASGQGFTGDNAHLADEAGNHLRLNNPIGSIMDIALPTTGYEQPVLRLETRRSGQGAGLQYYSYSIDGRTFLPLETVLPSSENPETRNFSLSHIPGAADNPDFTVRIAFGRGTGGDAGNNRFDNISLEAISMSEVFQQEFRYGYPVHDQWINTGEWMRWLYVARAPWVFHASSGQWILMPKPEEELQEKPGAWLYLPR